MSSRTRSTRSSSRPEDVDAAVQEALASSLLSGRRTRSRSQVDTPVRPVPKVAEPSALPSISEEGTESPAPLAAVPLPRTRSRPVIPPSTRVTRSRSRATETHSSPLVAVTPLQTEPEVVPINLAEDSDDDAPMEEDFSAARAKQTAVEELAAKQAAQQSASVSIFLFVHLIS